MTTMLASKGRFMALTAGLIGIAVYLGIALSWSEGLPMTQFAENKSEQPTVAANNEVIEVEEKSVESNGDQPQAVSALGDLTDVKADKSKLTNVRRTTTPIGKTTSNPDSRTITVTADPVVKVAPKPSNPLDDSIDPDVQGIAKLALTADFRSLIELGVDVSTAVRYIDERVDSRKYGDDIIRK
jgi:hypothetical protein